MKEITNKNQKNMKNNEKWNKAVSLMERDYNNITKQDKFFFTRMSKKQELKWEQDTIKYYYNRCTEKQMEVLLSMPADELPF